MCMISGCLVALRKGLSSQNHEERGHHIKGRWASGHGPGISGGERQEPTQAKGADVVLDHDLR